MSAHQDDTPVSARSGGGDGVSLFPPQIPAAELRWIQKHYPQVKQARERWQAHLRGLRIHPEPPSSALIQVRAWYPRPLPGPLRLVILAPDWAGLLDVITGWFHRRGYNITTVVATVLNGVGVVHLEIPLATEEEREAVRRELRRFRRVFQTVGKGGGAIRRMLSIAASKLEIFDRILRVFLRWKERGIGEYALDEKTLQDLISEEGEAVKFITARTIAYLEERRPEDLAKQILTNFYFQNVLRSQGRGVLVKAENLWTAGGWLTGVTVAGMDTHLSLDDVLDAIRSYLPHFHRDYDKQFISRDGITVVRVEFTDQMGRPLPDSEIPRFEHFLLRQLRKPRRRERVNIRYGIELLGRVVIPSLIHEAQRSGLPQVYFLPGQVTPEEVELKLAIVKPLETGEVAVLDRVGDLLSRLEGIALVSEKPTNQSRGCAVKILTLRAQLGQFANEEDIYSAVKAALKRVMPEFRDFDEGMRKLDRAKLEQVERLLEARRESDARFIREYFFSMEDFHRLQAPVSHIVEEIRTAQHTLERFQRRRHPVVTVRETPYAVLVCLVAPAERTETPEAPALESSSPVPEEETEAPARRAARALYNKTLQLVTPLGETVITRVEDYGISMFTLIKRKGHPTAREVRMALKPLFAELKAWEARLLEEDRVRTKREVVS